MFKKRLNPPRLDYDKYEALFYDNVDDGLKELVLTAWKVNRDKWKTYELVCSMHGVEAKSYPLGEEFAALMAFKIIENPLGDY